jgi:AhpD family alkylhydroperoxidase
MIADRQSESEATVIDTHVRMSSHDLKKLLPDVYPAFGAIEELIDASVLDRGLLELVRLRVSQINGCAYCVQYHIANGQEFGVPQEKLNLVVVWREAGIFSEREMAALAWAETLTLVAESRVPDDAYRAASAVFDDQELACLTAAINLINVWNRFSVAYRFPPEF